MQPFVGRQRELDRLIELNALGARVVTLWGPGGVGKTTLLRAFEARLRAAGSITMAFCDLSEARTQQDVQRSMAQALRIQRSTGATCDNEVLIEAMNSQSPTLLLIDNFEQVVSFSAATLGAWLAGAPDVRAFATSREPLGIAGEERLRVDVLPTDEGEALLRMLAASMGVALDDASDAISRIVRRLDGLPLAIRLAAARLDVLTTEELATRLEASFDVLGLSSSPHVKGRSTLRATVQWSWDLLTSDEQRALACLSVFRGGFEAAVGEAMLTEVAPDDDPLDTLASLRRKSLLHGDPGGTVTDRLWLHQTVQAFAASQLEAMGLRQAAERSHARVVLDRAQRWLDRLYGDAQSTALERLATEADNLLAVVERFADDSPGIAAQAGLTLHPLLLVRGPFEPHLALLNGLLAHDAAAVQGDLAPRLFLARGEVLRVRGDVNSARCDLERARELAGMCGDRPTEVESIRILGSVARMQGALEEALSLKNQALSGYQIAGDQVRLAIALGEVGTVCTALGRLQEAAKRHRAALDLHRALGNRRFEGIELSYLGVALHRAGDLRQAKETHLEALQIHREVGNVRSEAGDCCHLGYVLHQLGKLDDAKQYFDQASTLCKRVADRQLGAVVLTYLGDLACEQGDTHEAHRMLTEALAYHERTGSRRLEAITHLHFGYWHEAQGDNEGALVAFTAAANLSSTDDREVRCLAFAHLGLLLELRGDTDAAVEARRHATSTPDNPLVVAAIRALGVEPRTTARRIDPREARETSSSVRRALLMTNSSPGPAAITLGPDCTWFEVAGERVDLSRRVSLRGILRELVVHHERRQDTTLTWEQLFEAGWPGQKIQPEAALKRVYTAVWTLRKMGLGRVLRTQDDGYRLTPAALVRHDAG